MPPGFVAALLCVVVLFLSAPGLPAQETSKEEEVLFVAKKAYEDGFYEVSLGLLERFLKSYPSSTKRAEAQFLIGQCYYHQGKFLDALTQFEKLLGQSFAKEVQDGVIYWIAEVHFKGNNFNKASYYYRRVIDEFASSSYVPAATYSLGWCYVQESKFSEAERTFAVVQERYPNEAFARDAAFKRLECLYQLKEYAALREMLQKQFDYYGKDIAKLAYLHFYLAEASFYEGNYEESLLQYTKVLSVSHDARMNALAQLGSGWANLKLKRFKEAGEAFARVESAALDEASRDIFMLGSAVLASEEKRFGEAGRQYEELIAVSADQGVLTQAYLGKAESLYNTAEYHASIAAFQEALKRVGAATSPETVDKLHYGLAWAYLKDGEFKEAISQFQKIVKQSEDKMVKVAALCQIGDAYQDAGNYEKAVETYDRIIKEYPDSFYSDYVQYQLGLTFLKFSRYDAAIMAFEAHRRRFPQSKLIDDAAYALGLAYFQREDYSASRDLFQRFLADYKDSSLAPQALYLLGTSLFNLGKFSEAIEVFRSVIKAYGSDTELCQKAEYEIADCYYQMGDEKEAMARFKALRAKYPDSSLTVEVMWWLGEYYYRQRDFALAKRYFSSLISDFPKSALVTDAGYALGTIAEEEGDYTQALAQYAQVVSSGKADLAGTASIAIADIYVKQKQFEAALGVYREALEKYANLAALIYPKMGEVYRGLRQYDDALGVLRKSLEVVPVQEMGSVQLRIGEIEEERGRAKEAIEAYLRVTYLYAPESSLAVRALLRVAQLYENQEQFREAIAVYEKVAERSVAEAAYARERVDFLRAHLK